MHYLDLIDYFLSHVGEIFNYNFFKNFLSAYLFFFFLWEPYNSNIDTVHIVPKVSEAFLSSFHSFLFIYSSAVIFIILSSSSLIFSSALVILLLVPSRIFYLRNCVIHLCLLIPYVFYILGDCVNCVNGFLYLLHSIFKSLEHL